MKSPPICSALRSQRGFTLPELLLVIAVIGVLLALALPAFRMAQENARMVACTAKLRSVGMDVRSAAAENNGFLPWYEATKGVRGMWWYVVYQNHGASERATRMVCPADSSPYAFPSLSLKGSYAFNKCLGYQDKTGNWIYPRIVLSAVAEGARIPLLADWTDYVDKAAGFDGWATVLGRHRKGMAGNVHFVDGHSETIRKGDPKLNKGSDAYLWAPRP